MAIFMFSLTGIPPLAGFWGKLNLFAGALSVRPPEGGFGRPSAGPGFSPQAVIHGVLNAAISAGYYLRIIAVMYFRPAVAGAGGAGRQRRRLCHGPCALLVVGIGCYPGPLVAEANRAAESVRAPSSQAANCAGNRQQRRCRRPDARVLRSGSTALAR